MALFCEDFRFMKEDLSCLKHCGTLGLLVESEVPEEKKTFEQRAAV